MTRRTIATIVGLALGCTPLTAQAADAADPAAAAALRAKGLESGYNLDYDAAVAAFKDAIAADPNHPAAYRLTAATTWIRALFEQGAITIEDYLGQARASVERKPPSAALDAAFHESINRAIAISQAQLRQRPSDADLHYQVGAAYGYLASYTASIDGRLVGSLGAARARAGARAAAQGRRAGRRSVRLHHRQSVGAAAAARASRGLRQRSRTRAAARRRGCAVSERRAAERALHAHPDLQPRRPARRRAARHRRAPAAVSAESPAVARGG